MIMGKEDLRKVVFSIMYPQFRPGLSEEEQRRLDENTRERYGYFHKWVTVEEQSPQSGRFYDKTVALVEDVETGKLYKVDTELMKFKDWEDEDC